MSQQRQIDSTILSLFAAAAGILATSAFTFLSCIDEPKWLECPIAISAILAIASMVFYIATREIYELAYPAKWLFLSSSILLVLSIVLYFFLQHMWWLAILTVTSALTCFIIIIFYIIKKRR
jgi:hypothetical protein